MLKEGKYPSDNDIRGQRRAVQQVDDEETLTDHQPNKAALQRLSRQAITQREQDRLRPLV